ncbi:sensor histidine kinase [Streptomyces sp. NPDC102467]|uniref:sensor histidine kinase n=1 Tax=Streptomyces sp. NPDC102467 TaxID=3366179 RepID=UPI0037F48B12
MKRRRVPARVVDAGAIAAALLDSWVHVDPEDRMAVVCALLAVLSLTIRRRLPFLTYVLALPAAFVTDAVFATLAALYTLSSLTRHRSLLVVCAGAFVAGDTTSWSWPAPEFTDLTDTANLITVTYSLATAAAPVFLGQLVQARRELTLRIGEISKARESEQQLLADSVQAQERARLAREMHDVVSHQVSLIAVRAGALQIGNRDPETKEAAATIRRLSVQTLDELRHMVGVLRASGSMPMELTPQPSLTDLPRLVDNSGIDVELRTDLPDDLPPTVQRAVYRTVQEALTNVRKHAPGATATIGVRHTDGLLRTTVINTARTRPALPLPGAHYGLIGLRQRAELLGGTLSTTATADGGFQLCLELPVQGAT